MLCEKCNQEMHPAWSDTNYQAALRNEDPCNVCLDPWRRHLDPYENKEWNIQHHGCKYCSCWELPPELRGANGD